MKVFIFGGTTEGRELAAEHCKKGDAVTVSVASDIGAEELQGIPATVLTGRLDVPAMEAAIEGFDLVIDATHPYATDVTMNIKAACGNKNIAYQRVERDTTYEGKLPREIYYAVSHEDAARYLLHTQGNILLTTGSKNLKEYTDILYGRDGGDEFDENGDGDGEDISLTTDENDDGARIDGTDRVSDMKDRLYVRVLPTHEALAACEECGIPHSHIIAMHGPFSTELNIATIRQNDIKIMVTKESGVVGGFPEKVQAATFTDTELVIIPKNDFSEDEMTKATDMFPTF